MFISFLFHTILLFVSFVKKIIAKYFHVNITLFSFCRKINGCGSAPWCCLVSKAPACRSHYFKSNIFCYLECRGLIIKGNFDYVNFVVLATIKTVFSFCQLLIWWGNGLWYVWVWFSASSWLASVNHFLTWAKRRTVRRREKNRKFIVIILCGSCGMVLQFVIVYLKTSYSELCWGRGMDIKVILSTFQVLFGVPGCIHWHLFFFTFLSIKYLNIFVYLKSNNRALKHCDIVFFFIYLCIYVCLCACRGTAKQVVTYDYAERLAEGVSEGQVCKMSFVVKVFCEVSLETSWHNHR